MILFKSSRTIKWVFGVVGVILVYNLIGCHTLLSFSYPTEPIYSFVSGVAKHDSYEAIIITKKEQILRLTECHYEGGDWTYTPKCTANVRTSFEVYLLDAMNEIALKKIATLPAEINLATWWPNGPSSLALSNPYRLSIESWDDDSHIVLWENRGGLIGYFYDTSAHDHTISEIKAMANKTESSIYKIDGVTGAKSLVDDVTPEILQMHKKSTRYSSIQDPGRCLKRWIGGSNGNYGPHEEKIKLDWCNGWKEVKIADHSFKAETCPTSMDVLVNTTGVWKTKFLIFDPSGNLAINPSYSTEMANPLYCTK